MKTAFVISASPTQFSAIAYNPDLEKNIRNLAQLGFDGVELGVRNPAEVDIDLIKRVTKECGLKVCAIGTGQAYGDEGLSFSSPDASIRKQAVQRIKDQIVFASELDAFVIIGLIRGRSSESVNKMQALEWTKEVLIDCLAYAEEHNARMLIEPINRYETDLLNTVPETIDFIKELNSSRISLLLDTFHMNIEEISIQDSIKHTGDMIGHVHVADSNRWAPGCGHLDFGEVVDILSSIGYTGFLSAEILPLPDIDTAASVSIRTLRSILA